uniref:Uncharacterized protein n=1 Tax=Romanomermis culicivorax TaxID=13658 RepID=A0A915KZ65_ROMCU
MPSNTILEYSERKDDDNAVCKACRENAGKNCNFSFKRKHWNFKQEFKSNLPKIDGEMKTEMHTHKTDA